jgi:hypothetical protein
MNTDSPTPVFLTDSSSLRAFPHPQQLSFAFSHSLVCFQLATVVGGEVSVEGSVRKQAAKCTPVTHVPSLTESSIVTEICGC